MHEESAWNMRDGASDDLKCVRAKLSGKERANDVVGAFVTIGIGPADAARFQFGQPAKACLVHVTTIPRPDQRSLGKPGRKLLYAVLVGTKEE